MHVRKRIFTFLFAALVMALLTACGKWDYSREAMKAANDAQGETLRVEFKVNQTFTNALRAAAEDNIQPADVDKAMTMDKSIEKLLTSGYRLDVYALRADIDADKAAAQLADEFVNRLAGCEDEGYISMVKAENGYFYEAVLVYKHDSGSSGGGAGDDGNTGGGIDRIWVSWDESSRTLHFMQGAGDDDHVGTTLEKVDEEIVKKALIAYGDLEEGDAFAFTDVVNLVIDENSGITTINEAFTKRGPGTSSYDKYDENIILKTATLNGITAIGENAFNRCTNLTTVTLSKNVAVRYRAFASCWSLGYNQSKIDFSKITSIGEEAFAGCESLTTVDLSNLSGDGSDTLGKNAFDSCRNLKTVTLPENITHINDGVFYACYNLSSIDLSHVTYIGEDAFGFCRALREVNLENAQTIRFNAFSLCRNLTKINLGEGTKTFYEHAFYGSGVDAGTLTIYYGNGNDQELHDNLTVLYADGSPLDEPLLSDKNKKLKLICLASDGEECGNYAFGTTGPTADYEPAASYIPSTTAYSIPNPAARFILNL